MEKLRGKARAQDARKAKLDEAKAKNAALDGKKKTDVQSRDYAARVPKYSGIGDSKTARARSLEPAAGELRKDADYPDATPTGPGQTTIGKQGTSTYHSVSVGIQAMQDATEEAMNRMRWVSA
jgi:hypothetical protein